MDDKQSRVGLGLTFCQDEFQSKKEGKGQESIQSNNTIKPGLDIGSDKTTSKYHMKKSQEGSPIPAGDHKAARNRQDCDK